MSKFKCQMADDEVMRNEHQHDFTRTNTIHEHGHEHEIRGHTTRTLSEGTKVFSEGEYS